MDPPECFKTGSTILCLMRKKMKCHFLKVFKIIVETSLIAHSIGNFILKNFKTEHFLIKVTCEEI